MKTAMVLCLLTTIYGLSITVSKADNVNQNQQEFDVMKAYSDMGLNKAKLIVTNFAELIKLQASMTYIYLNIRKIFNARVITELNKTRAAADAAIAKGKDAGHCYWYAVTIFEGVQKNLERQFLSCKNTNIEDYMNTFGVFHEFLKETNSIMTYTFLYYIACQKKMSGTSFCNKDRIEKCAEYVEAFVNKYYPMYRKLIFSQTLSNILLCLHNYFEEGTKKVTKIGFIDQCVKGME
uniref:Venom protein n=1 Tax=Ampulex compressa TaxID=860918 RepID=A0A1W6EW28_AMPCP|nr:venom protein [Ampulex compressa]